MGVTDSELPTSQKGLGLGVSLTGTTPPNKDVINKGLSGRSWAEHVWVCETHVSTEGVPLK